MKKVTKAIILTAGYGTRWLPITKALEKNMIPVGNRPVIDYVVDDCIRAGITDIIFVVGENADQLRTYFGQNKQLQDYLKVKGKVEQLAQAHNLSQKAKFRYVVQTRNHPHGTAVPLWLCRDLIEPGERFLFVSGDQFYYHPEGGSEAAHLIESAEKAGTQSAMLAVEVPHEEVYKYGIVKTRREGKLELYESIVEKPTVEEAPTNLNNATFWLFNSEVFEYADRYIRKPRETEYYVTDVANDYVQGGNAMATFRTKGEYLDCGSVEGWLYANNRVVSGSSPVSTFVKEATKKASTVGLGAKRKQAVSS